MSLSVDTWCIILLNYSCEFFPNWSKLAPSFLVANRKAAFSLLLLHVSVYKLSCLFLCYRREAIRSGSKGRAKEIATVSLARVCVCVCVCVFRHPAVCACGSPFRFLWCSWWCELDVLIDSAQGYALWRDMYMLCLWLWGELFLCACSAMGASAFLLWLGGPLLFLLHLFLSLLWSITDPWEREREREREKGREKEGGRLRSLIPHDI